jgi:hypothetical protein
MPRARAPRLAVRETISALLGRHYAPRQDEARRLSRELAEGHSKLDAIRALKRYLAREVFTLITQRRKEINATRIAA